MCSAISGKTDKEAQRRDSLIVQAARNNNNSNPVPPPPKPSLKSMGFASVDDDKKYVTCLCFISELLDCFSSL